MMDENTEYERVLTAEALAHRKQKNYGGSTWGPWLFWGVAGLSTLFVWWLVIYDHGVVAHH